MENSFSARLKRRILDLLRWITSLGLVLAVIIIGGQLTPLRVIQAFFDSQPGLTRILSGFSLALTILGVLLLVGTQFIVRVGDEQISAVPDRTPVSRGRKGQSGRHAPSPGVQRSFQDSASFRQIKNVFRQGKWWKVPRWRRMTLMMSGGILMTAGLFGFLFFNTPPGVKLLVLIALFYAATRTIWGFIVA